MSESAPFFAVLTGAVHARTYCLDFHVVII